MKLLIIFIVFICLQAQNTNKYQDTINLWQQKVPKQATFSLKQFSNNKEMCGETPCELFYFLSQNPQITKQKDANRTVLLIAGLRGDDSIGPNILLNAYGELNAARIIFFPIPNPSGFNKDNVVTFPGAINVENDFPIGQKQSCNKTAALKSLHYLFKKYAIDLTIYLHDGKPSISYSWGSKYQFQTPKVDDFGIYADITDMVRFQSNLQKQLQELQSGSLYELNQNNESVYHFIDWAYGASKYPAILSKNCQGKAVTHYQKEMMNGLAFSLGVGKLPNVTDSPTLVEKYIKKNIEIIKKIIQITNPKVKIQIKSKNILLSLQGCKSGSVTSLKILSDKEKPIFERVGDTIVYGDVMYGAPSPKMISLPQDAIITSSVQYEVTFVCDNGWINIGTTAFSKARTFVQNGDIIIDTISQLPKITKLIPQSKTQTELKPEVSEQKWQSYQILILIVLLALAVGWMIHGIWQSCKIQRQQRIINFNEKFENVEVVEDLESFSNIQSDSVALQSSESKQGPLDTDKTHLNSTQ